ncbi:MAG: peptidase, partial [Nitrosopumilus sp.]
IQFLIKENILQIPHTQGNSSPSEIPSWIRNNAGWWASGTIDDASFINAIQFLIKERIIITS